MDVSTNLSPREQNNWVSSFARRMAQEAPSTAAFTLSPVPGFAALTEQPLETGEQTYAWVGFWPGSSEAPADGSLPQLTIACAPLRDAQQLAVRLRFSEASPVPDDGKVTSSRPGAINRGTVRSDSGVLTTQLAIDGCLVAIQRHESVPIEGDVVLVEDLTPYINAWTALALSGHAPL